MTDVFQKLFEDSQNRKDPFQRLFEAQQRQQAKIDYAKYVTDPTEQYKPIKYVGNVKEKKSLGDYANDTGVALAKTVVGVPQALVGIADLVDYGVSTATKGYQEIGAVLGLNERPEYEIQTGRLGKALEDIGIGFKQTQDFLSDQYSDAYKAQQQGLSKTGGEFSLDKSLGENLGVLGDKAAYVLENPALAANTTLESLGYIGAGGVLGRVSKGLDIANAAARYSGTALGRNASVAALTSAEQAIANSAARSMAHAAFGEGGISAGILQENIRNQTQAGYTTPEQSNLALAGGLATGLLGYGAGRVAGQHGVADIDNVATNGLDALKQAYQQSITNNSVSRIAKGAVIEGLEEVPQEAGEQIAENLALDKGNGNVLDGVADSVVLGFASGAMTGGSVNTLGETPQVLNQVKDSVGNAVNKLKDKVTTTSYEDLSNPDHEKYNPAQAYQSQLPLLSSEDNEVRQQAESNIEKLQTDITDRLTATADIHNETQQRIQALEEIQQRSPEQQETLDKLQTSLPLWEQRLKQAGQQYLDLQDEVKKAEDAQQAQNGTQVTTEQIKENVGALAQADLTPEQSQQAVDHVTKFMSQYDPDDLTTLSNSQYFTPEQRDSLRQLAESKIRIAEAQTTHQVTDNIINGKKGKSIEDSHRGLVEYEQLVTDAIAKGNTFQLEKTLDSLGSFTQGHISKADAVNEAFAMVNNGQASELQVAPLQGGTWKIIKNKKDFLSGKQAKDTGTLRIHVNSNKPKQEYPDGLINSINNEANLLSRTFDALNNLGTNFISQNTTENSNLTTNSIDTSQVQVEVTQPLSPEVPLTPDETNVVNSKEFKDWFGDISVREEINSRGVRGEGVESRSEATTRVDGRGEATGERPISSDDSRQDTGRVDGDNQTSTRRKIAIGGETYQGNVAVTNDGKPQLWFHGTAGDFTEFDLNHPDRKDNGWLGTGVYLTDSENHANAYADKKTARTKQPKNIMRLYTNASNFLELSLDDKNTLSKKSRNFIDKFTEAVKAKGYEGIILNHGLDYGREIVVFNPEQVKHSDGRNLKGYNQQGEKPNKNNTSTSVEVSNDRNKATNDRSNQDDVQGNVSKSGARTTGDVPNIPTGNGKNENHQRSNSTRQDSDSTDQTGTETLTESKSLEIISQFQDRTKQAIADEQAKPLHQRDIIKAHFDQKNTQDETKGSNPLVSVKDFISTLPQQAKGYIRSFIVGGTEPTQQQKAQLRHFIQFNESFTPVLRSLKNGAKSLGKQTNLVDFLRDEQGQFSENILTAMSLAAYSYLIQNGSKTYNTEDDIRKILRLEKDDPIPLEATALLQTVGAELPYAAKDTGKAISQALGLRVRKDSDPTLQDRLDTSFGFLVLAALHQSGWMTITSDDKIPKQLQHIMQDAGYESKIGETNKLTFIRSNYAHTQQAMDELVEASKETKGFLGKLFGVDVGFRVPTLVKPEKFVQNSIRQTKSKVPSKQAEYLTKAQQQSFTMRKSTVTALSHLKNSNENFLKQLLGILVTQDVLQQTHITQRDSLQSKAENEWRTLVNGLDWANSTKDGQGNYQEFYDTQTVSQNLRMSYNSNLFNMQSSQIHRAMAAVTGFKTEFNLDLATEHDQQMYSIYMAAIAEGMEGVEKQLKADILKANPSYKFFTIDKVPFADFIPAFEEWIQTDDVQKAIESMSKVLNQESITKKDEDAIAWFVEQGDMGVQSLQSLIALTEYINALDRGDKTFSSTMGLGSDGVNNGVASANLQTGVISDKMRLQTGIIPVMENQDIQNMQDVYRTGETDYYVDFGEAMKSSLLAWLASTDDKGKINGDKPWVKSVMALFPTFDPSNNEALAMRKIAKTWSVPFNYSAGKASLQLALANGFIDGIYKQMSSIANDANQAIKGKDADVYRTQQEKLNRLRFQVDQLLWADKRATSNPLVGVKPEQLNEVELGKYVENALKNAVTYAHGKAAWAATQKVAAEYIAIRDLYTQMETASFDLYNFVRTKLIEQKTKQAREQGILDKAGYMGLSTNALAEIDKQLLQLAPMLGNGLSTQSKNDIASGLSLINQEVSLESAHESARSVNAAYMTHTGNIRNHIGLNKVTETNAGVKGGALAIQGLDATVAAELQAKIATLNVHDAGIFGLADFTKGTQIQNEAYLQAMVNYHLGLEHLQTLIRTYVGLQDFLAEQGLSSEVVAELYDEILNGKVKRKEGKPVKDEQGEVVRESIGLLARLNKFNGTESISSIEQAIQELVDPIIDQDLGKLAVLADTFAIHQYAGEGGAVQVDDQHRQLIQEQQQQLQTKKQELLKQLQGESAKVHTPFVQWFEDRKGQDISKQDLLTHLGDSDLTQQEQVILNAVEKLIPDDLKVVYQDGDFEGHGFYEPKTNTITIKSKGSKGSKVDKHLVIHELLHSALATRIQAIKEGKANKEAVAAYNKLEALRKEILGKIGHLPKDEQNTLKGMLENVDEFISYGLTDQRLQEILQGISVTRNDRTAPTLRNKLKVFFELVSRVIGFAKSEQVNALIAFAKDTTDLLNAIQTVKPSQTDATYFQQSPETGKAYENRIDALFRDRSLARRSGQGVRMLDSSDLLDLLGFGGYEVQLDEQHIAHSGFDKHPEITQQDYKDLPKWLDDPVAVLPDENHKGKLVFITDQVRNGMQVIISVAPLTNNDSSGVMAKKHIAVTVYGMEKDNLKGLLKNNEVVYLKEDAPDTLFQSVSQKSYDNSNVRGYSAQRALPFDTLKGHVQKAEGMLNQDDLTRYRNSLDRAKVEKSPAWWRAEVKKQHEDKLVGRELHTVEKHIAGTLTTLGLRDSLSQQAIKRTQDQGIHPMHHVFAVRNLKKLWEQSVEVSKNTQGNVRHFESIYKTDQGNFIAHLLLRNGAIELVKLVPLSANTLNGELTNTQSKLRQQATTPNPQTRLNSQYSFDAVQDDDGVQFAQEVITELSEHDELFKYPKSSKATLQGIFSDVVGGAIQYKGEVTAADERQESTADHKYLYRFKGKDVYVYTRDNGEIWINVSKLDEGMEGSKVLAAFGNYAYNAKKVWIGDPKGMTDAGMIRLLSTQLSLALKFETTQFIQPSPEQQRGDTSKGIAALQWGNSDAQNIQNLVQAFVDTTYNQFEGLNEYRYDFTKHRYIDSRGRSLDSARLERGERTANARRAKAGSSTIKRAIFLKSLISSQSSERPNILGIISSGHLSPQQAGLKGIFYSQYSFDADEHVKGKDALEVFEQLDGGGISNKHHQHLNNIIQSTLGSFYNKGDEAKDQMNQLQDQSIDLGFGLSAKEQMVQQATLLTLDTYLKSHADSPIKDFIQKSFDTARKALTSNDLSQDQLDYMFKPSMEQDHLARFMSMALASEQVRSKLTMKQEVNKSKEKSWFRKLEDAYHYVMAWLQSKYIRLSPDSPIYQRIDKLTDALVKLDVQARQQQVKWYERAYNSIGLITTPLNNLLGNTSNKLLNNPVFTNSRFKVLKVLGSTAALSNGNASRNIPEMVTTLRNHFKPNERYGIGMELVNEYQNPSMLKRVFEKLIRQSTQHTKVRQTIVDGARKELLAVFSKDLSKEQHKAITYTLLRADLQSLLGLGMDKVLGLIKSPEQRQKAIQGLEQQILQQANGNDMLIRAKMLGHYMITNRGGEGLVKNAPAIAMGLDTAYQTKEINPQLVQQLDQLTSLYALEYVNKQDVVQVTQLLKDESEGIKALLNYHHDMVVDGVKDFEKNPLSYVKGYLPEITHPNREVRVAYDAGERRQLEREGWQFIADLEGDKSLMLHKDVGYQRMVSGAVDMMRTHRKGTEMVNRNNPMMPKLVRARLARANQRAKQSYLNYDPLREQSDLIAAYDIDGNVLAYNYEMASFIRDEHLERNNNFADLLGAYAGTNYYKPKVKTQHIQVAHVLYEDWKLNYRKNPKAYVAISPHSNDPKIVELWRMLPMSFKEEVASLYGNKNPIVVNNTVINMAFGFRKFSLAQLFDDMSGQQNFMEKMFVQFGKALLGDTAQAKIAKAEHVVQEIVKFAKDIIVIRSISVMWGNIVANTWVLLVQGIHPLQVLKDIGKALLVARRYQTTKAKIAQLEAQLKMGGDKHEIQGEIARLQSVLDQSEVTKFIEAGMLSSIVEDVSIQRDDYTYASEWQKKVDAKTKMVPQGLKDMGSWLLVSPNTPLYQALATATQLGDFVAKYSLFNHLQKKGMSTEEALYQASSTFINYDVPTSKGLQYLNDMGLFMFTKFFLRFQHILHNLLEKKAASVIGQHMAVEYFTNMQGILDPFALMRIGSNPIEPSFLSVFSAVGELPTVNAVF